ncbi:hypothetical protein EFE42_01235 [Methanohalophilus sp. RSK]|nr:hypothetical protein EFE42_01235 [Methanohalophilus sp. RSK]
MFVGFVFIEFILYKNKINPDYNTQDTNNKCLYSHPEKNTNRNKQNQSVNKGNLFEKYVVDRLDPEYFSIVEWTTDVSRKHSRTVESDMNPDLVVRFKPSNEMFAIECKYRSHLHNNKLEWSNDGQRARYLQFSLERNMPVFIVIGLGGYPEHPDNIFCIPLEQAKYSGLYPSLFGKYYHDPSKDFFWNGSELR